jgi:predicted transcriptional regulator
MAKGRMRNRHKLRIIYDILDCCSAKPLIISHIARKANVSSLPFYEVIEGLIKSGLLTKQEMVNLRSIRLRLLVMTSLRNIVIYFLWLNHCWTLLKRLLLNQRLISKHTASIDTN